MDGVVTVEEQVCIFLHILAHHVKIRTIDNMFKMSSEAISKYFNLVLNGIIRLQTTLLTTQFPVPENYNDDRWRWFKV